MAFICDVKTGVNILINPASTVSSAPLFKICSTTEASNSSLFANLALSIIVVSSPNFLARSMPYTPGLLQIQRQTSIFIPLKI